MNNEKIIERSQLNDGNRRCHALVDKESKFDTVVRQWAESLLVPPGSGYFTSTMMHSIACVRGVLLLNRRLPFHLITRLPFIKEHTPRCYENWCVYDLLWTVSYLPCTRNRYSYIACLSFQSTGFFLPCVDLHLVFCTSSCWQDSPYWHVRTFLRGLFAFTLSSFQRWNISALECFDFVYIIRLVAFTASKFTLTTVPFTFAEAKTCWHSFVKCYCSIDASNTKY